MDFEELFREHRADVERFVKFRLPSAGSRRRGCSAGVVLCRVSSVSVAEKERKL